MTFRAPGPTGGPSHAPPHICRGLRRTMVCSRMPVDQIVREGGCRDLKGLARFLSPGGLSDSVVVSMCVFCRYEISPPIFISWELPCGHIWGTYGALLPSSTPLHPGLQPHTPQECLCSGPSSCGGSWRNLDAMLEKTQSVYCGHPTQSRKQETNRDSFFFAFPHLLSCL